MNLRKLLLPLAALLVLCACAAPQPSVSPPQAPAVPSETVAPMADTAVRVGALKGPTAMGLVGLMQAAETGDTATNDYAFTLAASADELTPALIQGKLDIACLPANLAAVLYQNTDGAIQVLGVNTLGVLYLLENGNSVQSVQDLAGRTIYAAGKGSTPEYALHYVLAQSGLTVGQDVTVAWKSEHAECVAALLNDPTAVALLPQPFVTAAQLQNADLRIALDLTELWQLLSDNTLITGVVVGRRTFVQDNPEAVSLFLEQYRTSVDFVNANHQEAGTLMGQYDIIQAAVAQRAISFCNITLLTGRDMTQSLPAYLEVLHAQNPKAVGGALPEADFYYEDIQ